MNALREARGHLAAAGIENAAQEARWLLEHVTGRPAYGEAPSPEEAERLGRLARRRAAGEPLQYILGRWPFLERTLRVGPGVLAPRPETEDLCLFAAESLAGQPAPAVLDLCSGSGAIAIGLQAALPAARVTALEWDRAAFAYLVQNCAEQRAETGRAPQPLLADALQHWRRLPPGGLDALVANPPYVTKAEYRGLAPELRHEPKAALVAGEGGLAFYRAMARHYRAALAPGGLLALEMGETQGPAVAGLLLQNGWRQVRVLRDRFGRPRVVAARA